ncbi:DUF5593 domain-containing protein [Antrihabitans sp. YC3-6]|uniref:DUF5593 domain-containing protein n=1 Tax=Antrihabitans stalagmiti TaxID=2799499 RepID=A0A934NXA3_9NOCA|nr:GAF domain-containing protein [Antrihabitans stalagmiti]MBJ8342964.1 DUF5593 domain-containing protein [Antrihabitans stalagmiti]
MATEEKTIQLLVETLDSDPTVVVENGTPREFKRLPNVLRGAQKAVVEQLIAEVVDSNTERRARVESSRDADGGSVVVSPVFGPDKTVFGVQVTLGPGDTSTPASVAAWEWELGLDGVPPRLRLSGEFFDVFGIGPDYQDRSVYGPADYFARIVRLNDVFAGWETIKRASAGHRSSGDFVIRREAGDLAVIRYAQRCVETPAGLRLRGICRELSATEVGTDLDVAVLDSMAMRHMLGTQQMFAYILDTTFPHAPCVLKWLTSWVPNIGHGVSTGQTPAVHPDDLPNVIQLIEEGRRSAEPVTGTARVRRAGGGWISMRATGQLLSPSISETTWILMIHPDSLAETGVPSSAVPV